VHKRINDPAVPSYRSPIILFGDQGQKRGALTTGHDPHVDDTVRRGVESVGRGLISGVYHPTVQQFRDPFGCIAGDFPQRVDNRSSRGDADGIRVTRIHGDNRAEGIDMERGMGNPVQQHSGVIHP
jgi:hypothetical protein